MWVTAVFPVDSVDKPVENWCKYCLSVDNIRDKVIHKIKAPVENQSGILPRCLFLFFDLQFFPFFHKCFNFLLRLSVFFRQFS